jgi:hypothetical protein
MNRHQKAKKIIDKHWPRHNNRNIQTGRIHYLFADDEFQARMRAAQIELIDSHWLGMDKETRIRAEGMIKTLRAMK